MIPALTEKEIVQIRALLANTPSPKKSMGLKVCENKDTGTFTLEVGYDYEKWSMGISDLSMVIDEGVARVLIDYGLAHDTVTD